MSKCGRSVDVLGEWFEDTPWYVPPLPVALLTVFCPHGEPRTVNPFRCFSGDLVVYAATVCGLGPFQPTAGGRERWCRHIVDRVWLRGPPRSAFRALPSAVLRGVFFNLIGPV